MTWHTAKYFWPILVICALRLPTQVHTHSSELTQHCEHTPGAVGSHLCYGTPGAVGDRCLAQGTLSWYWRWRERCTFTPPTDNTCRTVTRTRNLSIMVQLSTIRPWLPCCRGWSVGWSACQCSDHTTHTASNLSAWLSSQKEASSKQQTANSLLKTNRLKTWITETMSCGLMRPR